MNLVDKTGQSLNISYGLVDTNFGKCFIASSSGDICFLSFGNNLDFMLSQLRISWYNSDYNENAACASALANQVFNNQYKGNVIVSGTDFQRKVWHALTKLKPGQLISYEELASQVFSIKHTRAVASAVAKNDVSYLIPCHRIINKSGKINKYRWGTNIKKMLIDYEKANSPRNH